MVTKHFIYVHTGWDDEDNVIIIPVFIKSLCMPTILAKIVGTMGLYCMVQCRNNPYMSTKKT